MNIRTASRPSRRSTKVPIVLQLENAESGAACLSMVLRYYGRQLPLQSIRETCSTSRDGVSTHHLIDAAELYGLATTRHIGSFETLQDLPLPAIVLWNKRSFVILERTTSRYAVICDPAVGRRRVKISEFKRAYSGTALTFRPKSEFPREALHDTHLRKRDILYSILDGSKLALFYAVLAGILVAIPVTASAIIAALFVEQVLDYRITSWVPIVIGLAAIIVLLDYFLTLLSERILLRIRAGMAIRTTSRFLWHLFRLPGRFYDGRSIGRLVSRVGINSVLSTSITAQFSLAGINLAKMLIYSIVLFILSPALTIAVVLVSLLNVAALYFTTRVRNRANTLLTHNIMSITGYTYLGVSMFENIKASSSEADYLQSRAGIHASLTSLRQRYSAVVAVGNAIPSALLSVSLIVILLLGGWQVLEGQLALGQLIVFQILSASFLIPIRTLAQAAGNISDARVAIEQISYVLSEPLDEELAPAQVHTGIELSARERRDGSEPRMAVSGKLVGKLEVRDLTFGFARSEPAFISGLSFTVEPGERVALVGTSGSGKSTLTNMLTGQLKPWSGEILFDGKPREQTPRLIMTSSTAKVDQHITLFDGSIEENIRLWDNSIPFERVIAAAKDAAIHDDIELMRHGYQHHLIEGGSNLSGGQRQRIEIARGLATDPSLIILDEATSALDAHTESIIDSALKKRGCTCIIVAHRLSTVRDCDKILVMKKGQIVELGTHMELMEINGHYARLMHKGGSHK